MGIYEAVTVNREKGDKKPASRNIFRPIRLFEVSLRRPLT